MALQMVTSLNQRKGVTVSGGALTQLQDAVWVLEVALANWEACLNSGGTGKNSVSGDFQINSSGDTHGTDAMSVNSDNQSFPQNLTKEMRKALENLSATLNPDAKHTMQHAMPTSLGSQIQEKLAQSNSWSEPHAEGSLQMLKWLRATLQQQVQQHVHQQVHQQVQQQVQEQVQQQVQHAMNTNPEMTDSHPEEKSEVMGSWMSPELYPGQDFSQCYQASHAKHPDITWLSSDAQTWDKVANVPFSPSISDSVGQDPIYLPLPASMTAWPRVSPEFEAAAHAKQEISIRSQTNQGQGAIQQGTREIHAKPLRQSDPETPSSQQTLQMHLRSLQDIDENQVVLVRKISRLGFDAPSILKNHFSWYGVVSQVRVPHSKVKVFSGTSRRPAFRWRPSSLGFIVMKSSADATAIIKQGSQQVIAGVLIQVQPFQQRASTEDEEEEEEDADSQNAHAALSSMCQQPRRHQGTRRGCGQSSFHAQRQQ